MSDLISRQAAIDALDRIFDRCEEIEAHLPEGDPDRTGYKMYPDYMTVWKYLRQLPSAQPEQRWIPCSERLPEDNTLMIVNYVDRRPYAMDIWIGWHEMENVWYIEGEAHSKEFGNEVLAWMPLPEPYRKDGD